MAPKTKTTSTASTTAPPPTPKVAAAKTSVAKTPAAKKPPAPKKAPVVNADGTRMLSPVPMPLAKKVSETLGEELKISQKDIKTVCEAFVKTVVNETMAGRTVALPNYFTFKPMLRKERTHKNPQTKEEIFKPAHWVLSMDVKANLKKVFEGVKVDPEALANKVKKTAVKKGGDVPDSVDASGVVA